MELLLLIVLIKFSIARTLPSTASLIAAYNVTQPGHQRLVTGQSRSVGHYVGESTPRAVEGQLFVFPPSLMLNNAVNNNKIHQQRWASDATQTSASIEPPLSAEEEYQQVSGRGRNHLVSEGPWLALLPEDSYTGATDQVTGALDAGASGVILVDWKQDELFSVMSPELLLPQQSGRRGVVVVIGPRYADQLLALAAANASLHLEVFPTGNDPNYSGSQEVCERLMVIVFTMVTVMWTIFYCCTSWFVVRESSEVFQFLTVIVLAMVTVVWTLIYCALRVRLARCSRRNNIKQQLTPTAQLLLQLVPARVLADGDLVDPDDTRDGSTRHCCIVCLDTYSAGDKVFVLPCRHFFHRDCIEPWLAQHAKCPVCKLNLLTYYQLASTSEESLVEIGNDRVRPPTSQPVVMVTPNDGDQVSELRSPRNAVRSVSTICFYRRPSCASLAPRRLMAGPNNGSLFPTTDNGASRRRSAPARPSMFLTSC